MRWSPIIGLVIAGGLAGLWVTRPTALQQTALEGLPGDVANGELVFAAAGCGSCHRAVDANDGPLSGGRPLASPFGTFYAPNISTDATQGIGNWTDLELASAITRGVSPQGSHYFPAFPYAAYQRAEMQDIADLIAYLRTLPASDVASREHDVGFPFNIRASLGGWKLLFAGSDWVLTDPAGPELTRGRYLVEALGHCGECHTPRNALGGLDRSAWLSGGPHPTEEGKIPNITTGALDWSEDEIAEYLKSGFTPEFDTAGGEMAEVVKNTAQLSDDDRAAIAAYLKAVPPISAP